MTDRSRCLLLLPDGDLAITDRPLAEPAPGTVRVRVAGVGICGSDVHWTRELGLGGWVLPTPMVLGHEIAGTVVGIGPGVGAGSDVGAGSGVGAGSDVGAGAGFGGGLLGAEVAVDPRAPCRTCDRCTEGRTNLCGTATFLGAAGVDGGLCEFLDVPVSQAHPLPAAVDAVTGALVEPLTVALAAVRRGGDLAGRRVLVIGAGVVGILVARLALRAGAAVTVVDTDAGHRARAAGLLPCPVQAGPLPEVAVPEAAVPEAAVPDVELPDVAFECAGGGGAARTAIRAVRPGGVVVLVGVQGNVSIPLGAVVSHELDVRGVHRYPDLFPQALDLLASGDVVIDDLVSRVVPLSAAPGALRRPTGLRTVVMPCR